MYVVLLALVDANYKCICVDVGGYGKTSDGGLFGNSAVGKMFERNSISIYY
jgi:hypothetical protein